MRETRWALVVTVGSLAVAVVAAALGWPGTASNCATGDPCFCEAARTGWVAQPANGWSTFAFVAAALWIARAHGRAEPRAANRFTGPRPYAALYCAIAAFLGPGSLYFHAGLREWGGRLDVLSMYLYIAFLLAYVLARTRGWSDRAFALVLAATAGALALDVVARGGSSVPVFGTLVALTWTLEGIDVLRGRPRPGGRRATANGRWIGAAVVCFFGGLALWLLSNTGHPLCDPDSLLQGHAAWHVLCAGAVVCLYHYFCSEKPLRITDSAA